jgi:hypothetical protein
MDIGIEYSCGDRAGVHVFGVRSTSSSAFLCQETARHLRNLCALVGPARIRVSSPSNLLAAHQTEIMESEWLLGLDGTPLIDIVSKWRGVQTDLEFTSAGRVPFRSKALSAKSGRSAGPPLPALVVNIGQSEIKFSMVSASLQARSIGIVARRAPWRPQRPDRLLADVETGVLMSLEPVSGGSGKLTSVVFSIGALVGKKQIALLPNGVTSGLSEIEIRDLSNGLASLPRRLGFPETHVTFINDGFLVAMAHRDLAVPGGTLAVRGGTSLCGGVDDDGVLGEIGWVGIRPSPGTEGVERNHPGRCTLIRDLLSAESFLAVESRLRADHLASALHRLAATVSCFHGISRIVLCGSLFSTVDRVAFTQFFSRISNQLFDLPAIDRIAFSELENQRNLAARGVANMVLAGTGS